jgi:murein DD-endopeptidase MepM/ murein hydrolase activator NlpD
MTVFKSDRPARTFGVIVALIVIAVLAGAAYFAAPRFEWKAPQIRLTPDTDALGLAPLEIAVADQGTGLKSVTATLVSGGSEYTLASEQYSPPVADKKISVAVSSKLAGLKEGPAVLRVTARDASLWNFFHGNETVLQKNITIDVTPPTVELIADDRYVNFGGVGAIVYKASPDTVTSGVKIGGYFFPGYPGQVKDHPDYLFALFAHPYNVAADAKATLTATDKAGNTREMALSYELKNVNYKKSTIPLTDAFLAKITPLLTDVAARQGTPKEIFVRINKDLRKVNEDKIAAVTSQATPTILWKGAFSQLSNSKVEANFADLRTYTYNGEPADTAYHLGYDLSVTKHYPIEAANSGKVAFTGDLGIYGNAVIIDHGLGLYTLYGHMSSIGVKVGDTVTQRQILGNTGDTGLAAGDHLHFGVYLHGVAVLPVEWWDAKWIADNIEPKLEGKSGEEIAEAQKPARRSKARAAKAPHKAAPHKRHR